MPVTKSGQTPMVSMSVPVPTPVQSAPKRPAVQFAPDETPQQPVGPSGVPPVAPPRPQMSAVILPWSPPPKGKTQMRRVRRYGLKFNNDLPVLYHGTKDDFTDFDRAKTVDGGFHFGNESQAKMRASGKSKKLIAARVKISRAQRSRDTGGNWRGKIAAAKSRGYDGIVYLNRYEGIPFHEFETARLNGIELDKISDAEFKKHVPSAADSYIAFHPKQIERVELPAQMRRLPRRVVRFSATPTDLAGLFRAARENPYEPTHHAVIADALDEAYPGNHVSGLIRRQFGFGEHGGKGEQNNLWYEPVENSWDGTFPYRARLGTHGPFNLYLGHESPQSGVEPHLRDTSENSRWVLHAVSRLKGSRDFGYTFEFPHESAHEIPRMFPAAANHIAGNVGNDRDAEASRFDDRMDAEERNRP